MKNFKLFVMYCALTSGASLFGTINLDDVDTTGHVMPLLAKSATLFRSSKDWQNSIQTDGATAETVVASTHIMNYQGLAAVIYNKSHELNPYHLMEDADSGRFTIKKIAEGPVEIHATLTQTGVRKARSEKDTLEWKKEAEELNNKEFSVSDKYTHCKSIMKFAFNEKLNRVEVKATHKCDTIMQYDAFKAAMDKFNQ